jgi:hypothetical protein
MKPVAILAIIFSCVLAFAQNAEVTNDPLVVVRNGRYGYIDHHGNIVIKPQFLWATDFEIGYGQVYVCGRYALIDKSGTLHSFYTPRPGNRLYSDKIGDKVGFVSASGEVKIKPQFDEALPFSDGMAAVEIGDHWGFIGTSGKVVIPPKFDGAYYFREGVGNVQVGDTTVFIDKTGKELARGYEYTHGLINDRRIPVGRNEKYGYLDLSGAIAIPLIYDDGRMFRDGLAAVQRGTKWGYINRNGEVVIPFRFDWAGDFGNGLSPVRTGNDSGFIDQSGSFAFHLSFEDTDWLRSGEHASDVAFFSTKSQESGYVDTSGNVTWGPTNEWPDHSPLFGWDAEGKKASCDVLPESLRDAALALPFN